MVKRFFTNWTKGKSVVAVLVLCLAVFGGYFGYHRLTAQAGSTEHKKVVNTLEDLNAMCASGKVDPTQEDGDKNNPFLILEIVPYSGQAEIGYLIEGCEPVACKNIGEYYGTSSFVRSRVTSIFAEEYDSLKDTDGFYKDKWSYNSGSISVNGYYERVSNGQKGDFQISGYYLDTSGVFSETDKDGNELPIYRPVFEKVDGGVENGFKWVSLGSDFGSDKLKQYVALEGKYVTSEADATADGASSRYDAGDREYTTRSDSGYYSISDGDSWTKYGYYVHLNDFLRTSLDLTDRTQESLDNFYLAVKTIEPSELAKNPEWIDYADLIYMHHGGCSIGQFTNLWKKDATDAAQVTVDPADTSTGSNSSSKDIEKRVTDTQPGKTDKEYDKLLSSKFTSDDDFSWQVAKKLFFKVNQLEEYDGEHTYGFAPLLFSVSALDNLNSISSTDIYKGDSQKKVDHYHLEYRIMESYKTIMNTPALSDYLDSSTTTSAYSGNGTNCNIYKFMLMNFLMDQQNFYNYFFENSRYTTGEPVINNSDDDTVGLCRAQDGTEAQEYWNVDAFLPLADQSYTNVSQEKCEAYGINKYSGAYLNMERPSLQGATFIYNSDSLLSQAFNTSALKSSTAIQEAFDWYKDEYGVDYSSMSPAQMIHYLLKYKKHANGGEDDDTRDKDTLHVLEIEPCADFTIDSTYLLNYLPKSKFTGSIEIDHMTTQQFNGYKGDINGTYDIIYIGDNTGKFNVSETTTNSQGQTEGGDTEYNDSARNQKIYLHVGDTAKSGKIRSSGDDISTLKLEQLKQFVQGENALVLADSLSGNPASSAYKSIMDTSSNMHKFINSYKTSGKISQDNICALKNLDFDFVYNNTWMYSKKIYSLPVRGKTNMNSEAYAAFKSKYQKYTGRKYRITSTPIVYKSSNADGTSLTGTTLDFSFFIGDKDTDHKYAVRIYMDTDYDGIISDNSSKSELVYDSNDSGTTYSYEEQEATDDSGIAYKDRYGDSIMIPKTQTVSFDFSQYYSNRKLLARQNGSLVWKFEVYRVGNKKEFISKTGTSRYYNEKNDKNTINALQVVSDSASTAILDTTNVKNTLFNGLIANLADYSITVTTVSLTDFIAGCTDENYLDSYTMLIISCGEEMQNQSEAAVSAVTQEAKDGISVIYTGSPLSKDSSAGAVLTASLKDMLNMSRFTDSDDTYRDENKFAGKADKKEYTSLEYSYAAVMEEGNDTYPVFNKKLWNKSGVKYGEAPSKTKNIAQTNSGGFTSYPYNIAEEISISGAVAQDYQLNMDNANLSVWYTLGGTDSDNADEYGVDNSLYGISPKDATNNYYLYSVDNVGYIGIDLEKSSSEDEMKLFVNTIVGITGYKNPYVDVVDISGVTADKKDGTLTLVEDKTTRELGQFYFDGELPTSDEDYLDYEGDDSISSNDNSEGEAEEDAAPPEETLAPTESPAPEIVTPEPTTEPEPEEDPLVLKSDDGVKTNSFDINVSNDTIKKYDDDAVFKLTYDSTADYTIYIKINWQDVVTVSSKSGNGEYTISLKDMKEKMKSAHSWWDGTFSSIQVSCSIWSQDGLLSSAVLYASQSQMEEYKNETPSGDDSTSGEVSNQDQDSSLVNKLKREEVTGDFAPDSATHKVSFIPYDGNVTLGNIRSFKITLVNDTDETKATTKSTIKKIYRDYTDAVGSHTWMYKASADGTFTIKDLNFVQDSLEYYFFYDDHYAQYAPYYYRYADGSRSTDYHYVKFDISNKKKSGVTYLDMYYGGDPDSTYVFKLD